MVSLAQILPIKAEQNLDEIRRKIIILLADVLLRIHIRIRERFKDVPR